MASWYFFRRPLLVRNGASSLSISFHQRPHVWFPVLFICLFQSWLRVYFALSRCRIFSSHRYSSLVHKVQAALGLWPRISRAFGLSCLDSLLFPGGMVCWVPWFLIPLLRRFPVFETAFRGWFVLTTFLILRKKEKKLSFVGRMLSVIFLCFRRDPIE